ncbi:MAG: PorT family protein [Tannerella sp.]|jgi:hypothetical protein|nr:PorT family protein [Tannerella sp.]
MTKITVFLIGCLLCVNTMVAQFTNSSSSNSAQSSDLGGWSGFRISYSPMKLENDNANVDMDFTGLSAGFVKGVSISSQAPVFVESGASFLWLSAKESGVKFNIYSIEIPLNIGYRYQAGEEFSVFPYIGLKARGNIAGSASYGGESVNLFDEDDMGEDNGTNRFQIGWQVGLGVDFNHIYLSASYGSDFSNLNQADDKFSSIPSFTLGLNF